MRAPIRYLVRSQEAKVILGAAVEIREKDTEDIAAGLWDAESGGTEVTGALITNDQGEVRAWLDAPQTVDVWVTDNGGEAAFAHAPGVNITFTSFSEELYVLPAPEDLAVSGMAVNSVNGRVGVVTGLLESSDVSATPGADKVVRAKTSGRVHGDWLPSVVTYVTDEGAVGDGSANDNAALQDVLTAAPDRSKVVFPDGDYSMTSLSFSGKRLWIEFEAHARLVERTAQSGPLLTLTDASGSRVMWPACVGIEDEAGFDELDSDREFIRVEDSDDVVVHRMLANDKSYGVHFVNCTNSFVEYPKGRGFLGPATPATQTPGSQNHSLVRVSGGSNVRVIDPWAEEMGSAVLGDLDTDRLRVSGGGGKDLHDNGAYISSGTRGLIVDMVFEDVGGAGVKARGSLHKVRGNDVENAGSLVILTGNGVIADALGANGHGSFAMENTGTNVEDGILFGIQDGLYPRHFTAHKNKIFDCSSAGSGGLRINCNYVTVTDNEVHDHNGTTAAFIISGVTSDPAIDLLVDCTITGNKVVDSTGDAFRLTNITDSLIAHNSGRTLGGDVIDARRVISSQIAFNRGISGTTVVVRTDASCVDNRIEWNHGENGATRSVVIAGTNHLLHMDSQNPEGVVAANIGSMWLMKNAAAGTTTMFLKETGSSTTGWVETITGNDVSATPGADKVLRALPSGKAALGWMPAEVDNKLAESINARDIGAVGDNATDNYAVIQAALNSANLPNVFLPHTGEAGTNQTIYGVSEPLLIPASRGLIAAGHASNANGVTIRALPGFTGDAVVKTSNWDGAGFDDWAHWTTIENINVDAAGLAPAALGLHRLAEESVIRRVVAYGGTEAGFWLTGTHAPATLELCSAWECPRGIKMTEHPTLTGDGNGGVVRLMGFSGDHNTISHVYGNGSHKVAVVGIKSEANPIGIEIEGSSTGGGSAIWTLEGGYFNGSGVTVTDVVKISGTSTPIIVVKGTGQAGYTNWFNDTVRSQTLPVAHMTTLPAVYTWRGESLFNGRLILDKENNIAWRRADTGAIVNIFQLNSSNHVVIMSPGTGAQVIRVGNAGQLGFNAVTPIARPSAYTQTYATADKTLGAYTPDVESAAYTGAADSEAKLVDLNALRIAVENLRAFTEDLAQQHNSVLDDLQAYGLLQ